ncbi:Plasma membrane [Venturia nashicola]|nr:Plasma membrane [Venturia nashicola]
MCRYLSGREPFELKLGFQRTYILTDPKDVSSMFKASSSMTFDKFGQDLLGMFGCSAEGNKKIWANTATLPGFKKAPWNPKGLPIGPLCLELFAQQFLPGPRLDEYVKITVDCIRDDFQKCMPRKGEPFLLQKWCAVNINKALTLSLLGRVMDDINPQLLDTFLQFNQTGWKLIFGYPRWVARDTHRSRDVILNTMEAFVKVPRIQRHDQAYIINCVEEEGRNIGLDDRDMAAMFSMIFWGINSNAYKICFWMLSEILFHQDLYEVARAEAIQICKLEMSERQLASITATCPNLNSVWNECLRLGSASASTRYVNRDTMIGNSLLRQDGIVMAPYSQMHQDPDYFGAHPDEFDHRRFLESSSMEKQSAFKPWGGGVTHCPGRHVAKLEVFLFVSLALTECDLKVAQEDEKGHPLQQKKPKFDMTSPCMGVRNPVDNQDIYVVAA